MPLELESSLYRGGADPRQLRSTRECIAITVSIAASAAKLHGHVMEFGHCAKMPMPHRLNNGNDTLGTIPSVRDRTRKELDRAALSSRRHCKFSGCSEMRSMFE